MNPFHIHGTWLMVNMVSSQSIVMWLAIMPWIENQVSLRYSKAHKPLPSFKHSSWHIYATDSFKYRWFKYFYWIRACTCSHQSFPIWVWAANEPSKIWKALQPENMKIKFCSAEHSQTIKRMKQIISDISYSHCM